MMGRWGPVALFGLLAACASIDDLSHQNYKRGFLRDHALARESVAALPMWAKGDLRSYLPAADGIFVSALKEMRPNLSVILPEESRRQIEAQGAESAYRSSRDAFVAKKVAREEDIRRIGRTLNVRFLLQTDLDLVEVGDGATQVRIRGELWDTEMGDLVWEGVGEARGYLVLVFPRTPATFEKTAEVASRGLVRQLP